MPLFKKKQTQIKAIPQDPWLIIKHSYEVMGEDGEIHDDGFIEFTHPDISSSIKKELTWIEAKGIYKNADQYKPPTLLDIWKTFLKNTPNTTGFVYQRWEVKRDFNCFIYSLHDISYNPIKTIFRGIIGDSTSRQQDFASFLWMLEAREKEIEESKPKQLFDLGEARRKKIESA